VPTSIDQAVLLSNINEVTDDQRWKAPYYGRAHMLVGYSDTGTSKGEGGLGNQIRRLI
jgi:hypothetical protein